MGRRKIEIQPIHDDRNRTVTFIKRKAGLFKKAHELAVLCQVDVAVIILGSNNTFYEFSSVDLPELLSYYNRHDLVHDAKQPGDFGNYVKKSKISLHDRRRKRPRDDEEEAGGGGCETAAGGAPEVQPPAPAAAADLGDTVAASKKPKSSSSVPINGGTNGGVNSGSGAEDNDSSPHFNPLQQHVQRQFQSLYAHKDREPPQRPVLRVQIPNNASCGGAIQSESSTPTSQHANPGLVSRTTSSVRRGAAADAVQAAGAGGSGHAVGVGMGGAGSERQAESRAESEAQHRRRELPPMFAGSPAFSHYLATPLQRSSGAQLPPGRGFVPGPPGAPGLHNGQGGPGPLGGTPGGPGTLPSTAPGAATAPSQQHPGLPPGSVPSGVPSGMAPGAVAGGSAAGELIPSPAISSVFPDWRTNLPSAAHAPPAPDTSYSGYTNYTGSTGLTPYIVINNTPLGNRFFNFERRNESEREEE
ncbi:uncharacterized protein ZBIST_2335 [Zygosaccharomyces bailii]|nr:uncharacterized protein ZBIST_2335 [Zygosaccharomyces bailii]